MRLADLQELTEYIDDPRFKVCLVPFLEKYLKSKVSQLCLSDKDGDKNRGEILAYNRFINLREELSKAISAVKARA